jgi:hypothetical protein
MVDSSNTPLSPSARADARCRLGGFAPHASNAWARESTWAGLTLKWADVRAGLEKHDTG